MDRCKWANLDGNKLYEDYHDNEWGVPSHDDNYLFEMLILESFHCGLSWLIVLKKREAFRKAFNDFNVYEIANFSELKIKELMEDSSIIRNKAKIYAAVDNAKAYIRIQNEFKAFSNYIWSFTNNNIVYGNGIDIRTKNELSDTISKDMKKRGFKFMGSVTTYSYLEAIGIMNNHAYYCFKHQNRQI